jgi:hypothetical protein
MLLDLCFLNFFTLSAREIFLSKTGLKCLFLPLFGLFFSVTFNLVIAPFLQKVRYGIIGLGPAEGFKFISKF